MILYSKNNEDRKLLERLLFIHPYTLYHSRIFGGEKIGLFVQFLVPLNNLTPWEKLISTLKARLLVTGVKIFRSTPYYAMSTLDLSWWDTLVEDWTWNVNELKHFLDYLDDSNMIKETFEEYKEDINSNNLLQRIKIEDLMILRELTKNSRRKQTEIKEYINSHPEEYKIPPGVNIDHNKVSRRIEFLEKNGLIKEYRPVYNLQKFKIFTRVLVKIDGNPEFLSKLFVAIKQRQVPFNVGMLLSNERTSAISWMTIPYRYTTPLFNWIIDNNCTIETYMLDVNYSMLYWFWHENFDIGNKKWKDDEDWINGKVLEELKKVK